MKISEWNVVAHLRAGAGKRGYVHLLALAIGLASPVLQSASAQQFPTKPVRLIIGSAPGSGNDIAARIVMAKVSESWRQQVVIENRPGANQIIAAEIVARATPDGYTLLLCGTVPTAINPALYRKLNYQPLRDLAPVTLIASSPNVLLVNSSAPAKSVKDFIAHVLANPGKLSFGSSGVGSTLHLSMEMLKASTGISMVHVPYKGGALAMTDLLGGHLLATFQNLPVALPAMKSGKVRALGVTAAKRSPFVPEVPTFAEAGFKLEIAAWYGVCAPAAVPKAVLARLNESMVKALRLPEVRERFAEMGIEPSPLSAQEFDAHIRSEALKWAKAVRDSGATAE